MSAAYAEAARYLHPQQDGFFSIVQDQRQKSYPVRELENVLDNLNGSSDAYLSQQTFRIPSRRLVALQQLGVCFVDCETHKSGYRDLKPEHQARALVLHCEDKGLPRPSHINHSGRGLHIKWAFDDPVPATALPRWNAVEKALIESLQPFTPDRAARDGSRCLRAVGTVNSRSSREVATVWASEQYWDFGLLADEVLPMSREELHAKRAERSVAAQQDRAAGHSNWWTIRQLWWNRLADVRKLIELRGWTDGIPAGQRNNFLFTAACCVAWSVDAADLASEIEALATEFCPTLPACEVRSVIVSTLARVKAGNRLRFSSARLVELLDIGKAEQRHLKTLVDADEREARHKEHDREIHRKTCNRATYEAQAQAKRETAQRLRAEGLAYKQIAERMGLSVNSVKTLLRCAA